MAITEKELMRSMNRVISSAMQSPEEEVDFFLTNLIKKIKRVSSFYPRRKVSDTSAIKDRLIENKLRGANSFIEMYNQTVSEITLEWVAIADKWKEDKITQVLKQRSLRFVDESDKLFSQMSNVSKDHIENLNFILEKYSLEKKDLVILNRCINKLEKISKASYKSFIESLKNHSEISEV